VAIIAVSILLGYVIVKYFILNPPNVNKSVRQSKDTIKVGTKLTLQEIDWQKNGRTVLLVLSPTCRYCTESGPFYSKLSQVLSTQKSATLVAVLPKGLNDAPGYLRNLGVSVNEIKQVAFDTLGVKGTPTIIIADKGGEVVGVWFGQLSSDDEEGVLRQLQAAPA
jgi:thioredoxin-related protein